MLKIVDVLHLEIDSARHDARVATSRAAADEERLDACTAEVVELTAKVIELRKALAESRNREVNLAAMWRASADAAAETAKELAAARKVANDAKRERTPQQSHIENVRCALRASRWETAYEAAGSVRKLADEAAELGKALATAEVRVETLAAQVIHNAGETLTAQIECDRLKERLNRVETNEGALRRELSNAKKNVIEAVAEAARWADNYHQQTRRLRTAERVASELRTKLWHAGQCIKRAFVALGISRGSTGGVFGVCAPNDLPHALDELDSLASMPV